MSLTSCLLVMAGGAFGTLLRYVISAMASSTPTELPWSTIAINIAGSFLIGFFGTLTLASGRFPVSENLRLLVMVGVCGGFTTFSSFSLQTFELLRNGGAVRAVINVVASVSLCILAVAAGHALAAHVNGNAHAVAQIAVEEEARLVPDADRLG